MEALDAEDDANYEQEDLDSDDQGRSDDETEAKNADDGCWWFFAVLEINRDFE